MIGNSLLPGVAVAGNPTYEEKAAYILNIARFTDWPNDAFYDDNEIRLCIIEGTPVAEAFNTIQGKLIQHRHVVVTKISRIYKPEYCQIVFISGTTQHALSQTISLFYNLPILTIGEVEGFTILGGMLNLTYLNDRLQFKVDLETIKNAGLAIRSQILTFAIIIE